ncbi:universal stress protein [Nocardioides jiangxiensis]|uniref:Universal stress protein n=1 Tax=Nocardioides jiangxiensis TaxID=3064524 RepID=A0ABT9B1B8_9ACTN|nr:universal stress protein [Nocardioides sp. WY-20]MDO7867061.1 universal stress protein [Nocardioides sp. WY-20]
MEKTSGPVVVGWDASPEAHLALQQAHARAERESRPLRVVIALGDIGRLSRWADEWTRGLGDEWCEKARKVLAELGRPDLVPDLVVGTPAEVLARESRTASAVVVGAGGHGPLFGRLLGSVSQQLARHAACPLLVVRAGGVAVGPVVVGVDGSPGSMAALEFALAEGAARRVPVDALYVPQHLPGYVYWEGSTPVELLRDLEAYDAEVQASVADVLSRHPEVVAQVRTADGSAAHEITRASENASLVVVGARGTGGLPGLLLGSVANAVLHHSHCPVAVIHAPVEEEGDLPCD